MRYLAIDYGSKRTGLAICDADETIASPMAVIASNKNVVEKIIQIIESENAGAIVFGLPLNMDDSTGPQAKSVLKFAETLKQKIDIPIHFQDERLTSFAAEEKLSEISRKKRGEKLDAVAAAEILQTFIDQKNAG